MEISSKLEQYYPPGWNDMQFWYKFTDVSGETMPQSSGLQLASFDLLFNSEDGGRAFS
jgi:hypothetical protein